MFVKTTARNIKVSPEALLNEIFGARMPQKGYVDAIFTNTQFTKVIGIANLPIKAPVMQTLFNVPELKQFFADAMSNASLLMTINEGKLSVISENGEVLTMPNELQEVIVNLVDGAAKWAGEVTKQGEHIVDLKTPAPGPHFNVNLLLGNRLGFSRGLQTTPKSVVDRLGRGSFRSHAATQVLATRFDVRQEENGFPANRQFYLFENDKQIFYSAQPQDERITSAKCVHSQNRTVITYETACSLEITRTIFLLPHEKGLPLATEVQRITIKNKGQEARNLRLVYTGMFGTSAPHAIFQDVTYTNVIMQGAVMTNEKGELMAISPDYYPEEFKQDARFVSLVVRGETGNQYPDSFCTNYNDFVGSGTLEYPANALQLNNKLNYKGPGFFAMGANVCVEVGSEKQVDTFTGLSSFRGDEPYTEETVMKEVETLLSRYANEESVAETLNEVIAFQDKYCNYFTFKTADEGFNAYANKNLAFQVLYQTFMSRSFCQTQKGFREVGFREIQDMFASMYYFITMGEQDFVKNLLFEWTANVYEMGYANHNFYWVGKEQGTHSDDGLWLLQAYYRYITYTGDTSILNEEVVMADGTGEKRQVRDTLKAVITYSAKISVGKHGLPILDIADWNDCLKIDHDCINGPTKQKLYKEQLERTGGEYGEPFENNYSESIMNAFLLKVAIDDFKEIAELDQDQSLADEMANLSKALNEKIQQHAWKEDFFARVLINRYEDGSYTYLGAKGDKLSADENIDGVYFLNSFAWSVLSNAASEEQIRIMIDTIKKYLLTPFGLRLVTPADLGKLADDTATGHYFLGDRENGAVFKHASMMGTAALLKAAKEVTDPQLAKEIAEIAYKMIDLVLPYKTMANPYVTCGNPRICTQYINSVTGENIGPLLSGTSTWLNLCLTSAAGIEYGKEGIYFNPILRPEETNMQYNLQGINCSYEVSISKPEGFARMKDGNYTLSVDGNKVEGYMIPMFKDGKVHKVELELK